MRRIRENKLPTAVKIGFAAVIVVGMGLAIGLWGGELTTPALAIGLVGLQIATFRIGRPARALRPVRIEESWPDPR